MREQMAHRFLSLEIRRDKHSNREQVHRLEFHLVLKALILLYECITRFERQTAILSEMAILRQLEPTVVHFGKKLTLARISRNRTDD
jgi:hypothetical protein